MTPDGAKRSATELIQSRDAHHRRVARQRPHLADPAQAVNAFGFILDSLKGLSEEEPAVERRAQSPSTRMIARTLADPAHIVSLLDGKPYKTLRRHLAVRGFSPEEYRQRFGLDPAYPMVARGYSEKRRQIAKRSGLGTQQRNRVRAPAAARQG